MLDKEEKEGLYNQLKNNKGKPLPKYTKEKLMEIFDNLFKRPVDEDRMVSMPLFWVHNKWEEDGKRYSSWSYTNGLTTLFTTGDGGKAEFDKILAQELDKMKNDL